MANKPLPSPEVLRQLLTYDPETGKLFWKARLPSVFSDNAAQTKEQKAQGWNTQFAGKEAFTATNDQGYKTGSIMNRRFSAHRVIWAMINDRWPDVEIDHRDGDKTNNRLHNLREASRSENARNCRVRSDNTSGYKGVCWNKHRQKWQANIAVHRKSRNLGLFDSPEEAHAAYCLEAAKIHGDYARVH